MRFHHLLVVMMAGSMVIFNFNNVYFFAIQNLNYSRHNLIFFLIVLFYLFCVYIVTDFPKRNGVLCLQQQQIRVVDLSSSYHDSHARVQAILVHVQCTGSGTSLIINFKDSSKQTCNYWRQCGHNHRKKYRKTHTFKPLIFDLLQLVVLENLNQNSNGT